ncbi:MAG: VOC family protein [Hyphomicrobiales bacterium]|nr:VOC family protein [Hyphomicrobiales bacterium]
MQIEELDHVNVRTSNLEEMVEWYGAVLGMKSGKRPPFPFPGAWLYAGDHAAIHLVGVTEDPRSVEPKIEHFALTASGLTQLLEHLEAEGILYKAIRVPGLGILQINLFDPDGNHIHIDFSPEEADAAGL